MDKGKPYKISPVTAEDADAVMALVKRTFYIDEPLNQTIGLCASESDPCPELDEYCIGALTSEFSFKATDHQGNVIGAMLSSICPLSNDNHLLKQAQQCQNPKFQKILYILAQREDGAKLWEKFPNDKNFVEVHVAATAHNWRKKGIMNALIEETEKAVKQNKIRLLRLDTSSAYSAMAAERLGYKCYYRKLYTDIKMNDEPLIVPEPPHVDDRVHVKELH